MKFNYNIYYIICYIITKPSPAPELETALIIIFICELTNNYDDFHLQPDLTSSDLI